jgi:hypothetical protein
MELVSALKKKLMRFDFKANLVMERYLEQFLLLERQTA